MGKKPAKKRQDAAAEGAQGTQAAARHFHEATRSAADVLASAEKELALARGQQGSSGSGGDAVGGAGGGDALGAAAAFGGRTQLDVSFPTTTAPAPSFAGVCVVHRFPEYILLDFGSIDPLQVEPTATGQKALLQHVARICLPEQTARRLMLDLANLYGHAGEG